MIFYGNKNYVFYSIDKVMMIENVQFATVTTCEHDMLSGMKNTNPLRC